MQSKAAILWIADNAVIPGHGFVPCDPMNPDSMKSALAEIDRLREYVNENQATVAIAKTKFVRRREDEPAGD